MAPACADGGDPHPIATGGGDVGVGKSPRPPSPTKPCAIPSEGCPCDNEGQEIACGETQDEKGDYLTCATGTRACIDGKWGACFITETTTKSLSKPKVPGVRAQAEGQPEECPEGYDKCDPYCNWIDDKPDEELEVPDEFIATPEGLTILATGTGGCALLEIEPSSKEIEVTELNPLTTTGDISLKVKAIPAGCAPSPFETTWVVDAVDRAVITGTNNQDGLLKLALPIGGPIVVSAYAVGLSTSTSIGVRVNVLNAPTSDSPNNYVAANSNQRNAFGTRTAPLPGTVDSTAEFLYPYEDTYFPLALPAPVIQYLYKSNTPNSAVKVSLRYPVGRSATDADFNYSFVVAEANIVSRSAGRPAHTLDPQVILPEIAWDYFEETARGNDAEIIIQRRQGNGASGVLERELRRRIHFVDGQLKGTVYYNSYSSPQGNNTGAVLRIDPGATSPTRAVQPNGNCTVCHSVNSSGTRLIANGTANYSTWPATFNISNVYKLNGTPVGPAYPQREFTYYNGNDTEYNVVGNRFTYGGPWKNGNLYMTHSGRSASGGDQNWRSPNDYSRFMRVQATPAEVSVANWSNVVAITPRFSPDGTKLAFGFWGGNNILGMSPDGNGRKLAVVDFGCNTQTCSDNSSGFKVTNPRNLTPGVGERVAWPSFTPDGKAVVYQRQYRGSRGTLAGDWGYSYINTSIGALAELWMSNVPNSGDGTPTRLSRLNGVNLPQRARVVVDHNYPLYNFPVHRYDAIRLSGTGTGSVYFTGSSALADTYVCIQMRSDGNTGTARFRWKSGGGVTASCSGGTYSGDMTTSSSPIHLSNGLHVNFTGSFRNNDVYVIRFGSMTLAGTPSGGPWDFRVRISGAGALGAAKAQYSTDGGATYSTALTIPASGRLELGSTGLVATFDSGINYVVNWAWGSFVSHYHQDGAKFQITQPDLCTNAGIVDNVRDSRMNYLPNFAPVQAGGYNWLIFTSRRMYGNIAYDDPWDAEAKDTSGNPYWCHSGVPPSKKLWIAAIDSNFTPGTDPSHPAFYLPGQELAAGNSDAYWVSSPCLPENAACQSNDDCCGGSGPNATASCKVTDASSFPPVRQCKLRSECSAIGEACSTSADCCTGSCPAGGGVCVFFTPPKYEEQVYEREYVAECPFGTHPVWRYFEWQATIPTGARLDFSVQTKLEEGDDYRPSTPINIGSATLTTPDNAWQRSSTTVDDALKSKGLGSFPYLKLQVRFVPTPDGNAPPVLNNWRQVYDCVPAE